MRASWKWKMLALGTACLLAALPSCRQEPNVWEGKPGLRVVVSFPPLYSMVKSVAGDDATVISLLTNEGPHGYQYNASKVRLLREADLFVTNGLNLDDNFAERMKNSCGNSKLTWVKVAESIDPNQRAQIKEGGHVCPQHPPGSVDPHVWLGLPEAIIMVEKVNATLKARDPAHAADYDRRAKEYIGKLEKLLADGQTKLASKNIHLISVHESLTYFARAFNITIAGSIQMAPGDEPTGNRLRDLARLCVEGKEKVRIIAVEPQYPENTARTLLNVLKEKGVADPVLVEIDPLETAEPKELDEGWFERKMAENIDNLARAVP